MPDVVLVAMPFVDVNRPSLALSTLKAILDRQSISCAVHCAYIRFAEIVGTARYVYLNHATTTMLLGEWVYSRAAFRSERPSIEAALDEIMRLVPNTPEAMASRGRSYDSLEALAVAAEQHVEETAQAIVAMKPRIVGCTSTFQQHVASLALLRRIRELAPEIITMMGGANCEARMGVTTHRCFDWVDYVVSGDADALIGPLCRKVFEKGRGLTAAEVPLGVFAPVHRATSYPADPARPAEPARAVYLDMDALPYPDFSDYFAELSRSFLAPAIKPTLVAETSRGCWWGAVKHCTFCGLNGGGMNFRSKSPDRAYEELDWLASRWGIDGVEIVDNILDMKYFNDFIPQLERSPRDWRIFYETKSNLKRGQVRALANAGIHWIQPGIESLHSKVLTLMDKGASAYQQILLLKWTHESGVRTMWNLLWGFPLEDDTWYAEMAEFIPALTHLQPPSGPSRVRYDRFSPYFDRAADFGLRLSPMPMFQHIYPLSAEDRFDQSYFFVDDETNGKPPEPRPGFEAMRREVRAWRSRYPEYRRHPLAEGEAPPVPPVLTMRDDEETLHIIDTRDCAVRPVTKLSGLSRLVYLAAEESIGARQLSEAVAAGSGFTPSPEVLNEILDDLRRDRLLLTIDGRHVSLALREGTPEWPLVNLEYPGGEVDVKMARHLEHERTRHGNLLEMLLA